MISIQWAHKRKNLILAMSIVAALSAWQGRPARASLESAELESIYFTELKPIGYLEPSGAAAAKRWAGWLKLHRAIVASPQLRREYARASTNRDGDEVERLKRQVPAALLNKQSSHVYVLHIGTHRSPQSAAKWVKEIWPRAGKQAIYKTTPKSVYFRYFAPEGNIKSEPLYVLPDSAKDAQRVCYGMYASRADAAKDAARLKLYLRIQPGILQRPLTRH